MADAAYTVVDPGGKRWAQLLDQTLPIRQLVPALCQRLDLPSELQYRLTYLAEERTLKVHETLAAARVPAGSELQLAPVRNALLRKLLDKLYEEARDHVLEELWDRAAAKWAEIRRLDENYPDPLDLQRRIKLRRAAPIQPLQPSASPRAAASAPAGGRAASGRAGATAAQPATAPAATTATTSGGSGCATLFKVFLVLGGLSIVGGVVVVIGLGVLVALAGDSFSNPGPQPPLPDHGRVEPVLGTGDVQVTLRWSGTADVDLHVVDPFGEEIYFQHKTSVSGGRLDVDANGSCAGDAPVENVFWPTGGGPSGVYQIAVVYYYSCGVTDPVSYDVTVHIDGRVVETVSGTLYDEGELQFIGQYVR